MKFMNFNAVSNIREIIPSRMEVLLRNEALLGPYIGCFFCTGPASTNFRVAKSLLKSESGAILQRYVMF